MAEDHTPHPPDAEDAARRDLPPAEETPPPNQAAGGAATEGEPAAPPGDAAAPVSPGRRAGEAARRLEQRSRQLGGGAVAGLRPAVHTVRQDLGAAFGHIPRLRYLGPILFGLALLFYLLSGAYVVSSGETAVVTRFGQIVEARVAPGLRWRLPWPFEVARTVNVTQVRREGIGVTMPDHSAELHPPEEIQLLTGDENLLTARAIVQYRVRDPADYLFRVDYNEDPLLRNVVKAVLTELAGSQQVDSLLTSGRPAFQQQAREQAQRRLDAYRSGIELVSIDLQEIVPPGEVAGAFRDVSSAGEEKNKLINDAQGYANSIVPQARGEAQKRLQEAEGYKTDVMNRAQGEARRFADVLAQYRRDAQIFGPATTRYRLYIETMEKILPKARKYIVEPGQNGEQLNLRLLEQLPDAVTPGGP